MLERRTLNYHGRKQGSGAEKKIPKDSTAFPWAATAELCFFADRPRMEGGGEEGEVKARARIAELEALVADLQAQLEAARAAQQQSGVREELPPLEEVRRRLQAACVALVEAGPGQDEALLQADFDHWSEMLQEHPEFLEEKAREEAEFEARQAPLNRASLLIAQAYFPHGFQSKNDLLECCSPALAERLWDKRVLWLVGMDPEIISKLHVADLRTKFSPHALDLVELRAVCAALPERFENDASGEKQEWRDGIKKKLKNAIVKVDKLKADEIRHPSYFEGKSRSVLPKFDQSDEELTQAFREIKIVLEDVEKQHEQEAEVRRNKRRKRLGAGSSSVGIVGGKNPAFANHLAAALSKRGGGTPSSPKRKPPRNVERWRPEKDNEGDSKMLDSEEKEAKGKRYSQPRQRSQKLSSLVKRFESKQNSDSSPSMPGRKCTSRMHEEVKSAVSGRSPIEKSFHKTLEHTLRLKSTGEGGQNEKTGPQQQDVKQSMVTAAAIEKQLERAKFILAQMYHSTVSYNPAFSRSLSGDGIKISEDLDDGFVIVMKG